MNRRQWMFSILGVQYVELEYRNGQKTIARAYYKNKRWYSNYIRGLSYTQCLLRKDGTVGDVWQVVRWRPLSRKIGKWIATAQICNHCRYEQNGHCTNKAAQLRVISVIDKSVTYETSRLRLEVARTNPSSCGPAAVHFDPRPTLIERLKNLLDR